MPIYRYRNLTTNETFDLEQRITENALSVHPETGDPVKRLIQPVGIAFKGSGFYVNDSRSTNSAAKPGSAKTDKGEGSSTEAKSGDSKSDNKNDKANGKSDSKSEKKPEKAASAS